MVTFHQGKEPHEYQPRPRPGPPRQPYDHSVPRHGCSAGAGALLGLRSAIILMLGVLVGTGTGVLTLLAQRDAATAVLAGGAAFAGSVLFFHTIIAA